MDGGDQELCAVECVLEHRHRLAPNLELDGQREGLHLGLEVFLLVGGQVLELQGELQLRGGLQLAAGTGGGTLGGALALQFACRI